MKNKYSFILFILFFGSCTINGSFQGLYSYYKKTQRKNPNLIKIIPKDSSICSLKNGLTPRIYAISAKQLEKCLKETEKVIIYIWAPKCQSEYCYPLATIQKYCDENNITLFIVSEYYDTTLMQKSYNIKNPVFGINTEYYKTDVTTKYLNLFLNELINESYSENRFLYLKKGILITKFKKIGDISMI